MRGPDALARWPLHPRVAGEEVLGIGSQRRSRLTPATWVRLSYLLGFEWMGI